MDSEMELAVGVDGVARGWSRLGAGLRHSRLRSVGWWSQGGRYRVVIADHVRLCGKNLALNPSGPSLWHQDSIAVVGRCLPRSPIAGPSQRLGQRLIGMCSGPA
jgi:hypothetical protein